MVHHEVCVDDGFWKWCTLWFSSSRKIFVLTYVYMKRYRHLNICSIGALYVHCYDESYVHHTLICELIKWQCCILSLSLLNINVEGETILLETPLKHPHEDTYDPRWAHYKIIKNIKSFHMKPPRILNVHPKHDKIVRSLNMKPPILGGHSRKREIIEIHKKYLAIRPLHLQGWELKEGEKLNKMCTFLSFSLQWSESKD